MGPTWLSAADPVSFTGTHKDSAGRERNGEAQRKRGDGRGERGESGVDRMAGAGAVV